MLVGDILENEAKLQEMIYSVLAEYIANEVMKKIAQCSQNALVLFTEAGIGAKDAISALVCLEEKGWKFKVIVAEEAKELITAGWLSKLDVARNCADALSKEECSALVKDYSYVIIPTLSISTAAKIAVGIADDLSSKVLFQSISLGKEIIACIDGCCPDNAVRAAKGFYANEAYRQILREHITTLKEFGIRFTTAQGLTEKMMRAQQKYSEIKSTEQTMTERTFAGKILSRGDVLTYPPFSTLYIGSKTIVTALASEELKKQNIKLIVK